MKIHAISTCCIGVHHCGKPLASNLLCFLHLISILIVVRHELDLICRAHQVVIHLLNICLFIVVTRFQ